MKKKMHIIWNIIQIIVIIYAILITTLMFLSNEYGYTEVGSYVFNNNKGDLLLIKKDKNIKEKDIIYYYIVDGNKYNISSDKVISIEKDNENSLYKVKDDSISSSKVIGKKTYKIKLLGDILEVLEGKVGFLLLVLLPVLIVFIYQVYEFIISIHNREIKE